MSFSLCGKVSLCFFRLSFGAFQVYSLNFHRAAVNMIQLWEWIWREETEAASRTEQWHFGSSLSQTTQRKTLHPGLTIKISMFSRATSEIAMSATRWFEHFWFTWSNWSWTNFYPWRQAQWFLIWPKKIIFEVNFPLSQLSTRNHAISTTVSDRRHATTVPIDPWS